MSHRFCLQWFDSNKVAGTKETPVRRGRWFKDSVAVPLAAISWLAVIGGYGAGLHAQTPLMSHPLICTFDEDRVHVLRVAHRKDIYRKDPGLDDLC